MKHRAIGSRLVGTLAVTFGVALAAPAIASAQSGQHNHDKKAAPALSSADSAACATVIGYAMQNPQVLQKGEQLQSETKVKTILTQPDSVRAGIAKAIERGQGDTLKAMARRLLDAKTAPTYDEFIDFVVAFPDSVRGAIGTLLTNGKPLMCS